LIFQKSKKDIPSEWVIGKSKGRKPKYGDNEKVEYINLIKQSDFKKSSTKKQV